MRGQLGWLVAVTASWVCSTGAGLAQEPLRFGSSLGEVAITPLGHASLRFEVGDRIVFVDPWGNVADFSAQPAADLVLVTHEHQDHFDPAALAQVTGGATTVVMDGRTADQYQGEALVLENGDSAEFEGITVTAVPAYNMERMRDDGEPYHSRGAYNGYLVDFGDLRVLIAGDTECVPELRELTGVDVAFLPINLPFTMPPEEAAECYRSFSPAVAVPYHQGESDPQIVADLLADTEIEVRVLPLP